MFQIELRFMVPAKDDETSRVVAFEIPPALRNSLEVELKPGLRLTEAPGVAETGGVYRLPVSRSLQVRFTDRQELVEEPVVEVDLFSRLKLQEERLCLTSTFVAAGGAGKVVTLQAPEGARCVPAPAGGPRVKKMEGNLYEIELPRDVKHPFSLQFLFDGAGADSDVSFCLPTIRDNRGT